MRIVFVISCLITGGAETQLIALSRELAQRGHAVAIYTLNRHNPRAAELNNTGVELIVDQKCRKLDFAVIQRLRCFVKAFKADVIQGFLYDGNIYSRLAVFGGTIPVLNSERNDNYRLNINQQIAHNCTKFLTKAVVANSYSGARFAGKVFGFPDEHIHVVWNGLDLEQFDEQIQKHPLFSVQAVVGGEFKVACLVGSIKPPKDYILALKVAELLTQSHSDWRVIFVGDALSNTEAYKQQIMTLFQELKLADRAYFVGLRDDVPSVMRQCQVVFSTSKHEGFPNVVLEAMAVGVPVVSTEYSDIRKILPMSWQVVEQRDELLLANTIIRANQEHKSVAEAQRKWVEKNATIQMAAKTMEQIYTRYIGEIHHD